jgi:catechol 2,3-dioxygenase-like lactoylglutathione lyase family enzyme
MTDTDTTLPAAKAAARALRVRLAAAGIDLSHGLALEAVAAQLGHRDWNTAVALLPAEPVGPGADPVGPQPAVPVLRVLDADPAREFYVDYLGFTVEWEHRFEPDLPLYVRVRRGRTVLDLSEHHGDGTGGAVVFVPVEDVGALHAELQARPHPRLRPGIVDDAPGGPTLEVTDPFGNSVRFCQVRSSSRVVDTEEHHDRN